jgi:hypothetical protein
MSCAICATRKEKRFCPAVHDRICPVCCGTEREVTLDCPGECIYLQQARKHEKPRELADEERAALFPDVKISETYFHERGQFLGFLNQAVARVALANRAINDRDLIAALTAAATSYQTLVRSGLHYAVSTPGVMQHALTTELEKMIAAFRQNEEQRQGYSSLRDSDILNALVAMLRAAYRYTSGRPKSRAFIDALVVPSADKQSALLASDESGGRILLP